MNRDVGQIAKEWFEKHEPEGALAAAILRCFFVGAIIKRPGFLLMGETCFWDGQAVKMAPREEANAWFIHFWTYMGGNMSSYDLCLEAPFPMEWVLFKRRGKVKAIRWEKLYAKDLGYRARNYVGARHGSDLI